jgi:hypothetical protein
MDFFAAIHVPKNTVNTPVLLKISTGFQKRDCIIQSALIPVVSSEPVRAKAVCGTSEQCLPFTVYGDCASNAFP